MLFVERCLIFIVHDHTLTTSSGTYPSPILEQSLSGITVNISETARAIIIIQKKITHKIVRRYDAIVVT